MEGRAGMSMNRPAMKVRTHQCFQVCGEEPHQRMWLVGRPLIRPDNSDVICVYVDWRRQDSLWVRVAPVSCVPIKIVTVPRSP